MSIAITALDHVQITVPPEMKARGGAWYALGTVQLHLAIDPGASGVASRRHVCFRVADVGAARTAPVEKGLTITDEPITADGLVRFFVRDRAGNRIEIGERR